jgi:IgGFc binding protein
MPRRSFFLRSPSHLPVLLLTLAAACRESPVVTRGAPSTGGGGGRGSGGATAIDSGFSLPGSVDAAPVGGSGDAALAPGSPMVEPIEDCATAAKAAGNLGCTFYSVPFAFRYSAFMAGACHAMFVVNPGRQPVKLRLDRGGADIPLAPLARLPRGSGRSLELRPYDEVAGLAGGDVAILFLRAGGMDNPSQDIACPEGVTAAERGVFANEAETSFTGRAFRLVADRPVAAYQIFPYGGGGSQVTSATLLLPTETWGAEHYVATPEDGTGTTFVAVVAKEDGTEVSLRPTADVLPLRGMPATSRGGRLRVNLGAGELLWVATPFVTQPGRSPVTEISTPRKALAASLVVSSKPVGVIGGASCTFSPAVPPLLGQAGACDSVQQQAGPIAALGHEYAAVRHRTRLPPTGMTVPSRRDGGAPIELFGEELGAWQLMGVVEGTTLSYSPSKPEGAPTSLAAGQVVQFATKDAFVVRSQDADHPFYLGAFMTGGQGKPEGQGDPDFVNVLPVAQYQSAYVFFTDPTYPETSLVVVRQKGADARFADVRLDCAAAPISGWRPLGDLEFTWVDLATGNFQPAIAGCDTGRREMTSAAPFAVTVWGWGRGSVSIPTARQGGGLGTTNFTSYAFPAGGGVRRINRVPPPIID